MAKTNFQTIDEYIATFPAADQEALLQIRRTIHEAVPEAEEAISYQIPVFKHHGPLVYFSAHKNHYSISIPPPFSAFQEFRADLEPYAVSKSAVQFPKDAVPHELIARMVAFTARQNEASMKGKAKS